MDDAAPSLAASTYPEPAVTVIPTEPGLPEEPASTPAPDHLDVLHPLSALVSERPAIDLQVFDDRPGSIAVPGRSMPEPFRSLLVHESDMTSTLERHYGETLVLHPLDRRRSDGSLWRRVLLVGERSGAVREAGAIRIALGRFPTEARWAVLGSEKPLGAILAEYRLDYRSAPRRFFGFRASPDSDRILGFKGGGVHLYGRQNVLTWADGEVLAEVVEILPQG